MGETNVASVASSSLEEKVAVAVTAASVGQVAEDAAASVGQVPESAIGYEDMSIALEKEKIDDNRNELGAVPSVKAVVAPGEALEEKEESLDVKVGTVGVEDQPSSCCSWWW